MLACLHSSSGLSLVFLLLLSSYTPHLSFVHNEILSDCAVTLNKLCLSFYLLCSTSISTCLPCAWQGADLRWMHWSKKSADFRDLQRNYGFVWYESTETDITQILWVTLTRHDSVIKRHKHKKISSRKSSHHPVFNENQEPSSRQDSGTTNGLR